MSELFRIFIGYDAKEPIAYHVLSHSILRRASRPVSITPLCQHALRSIGLYRRERGPTESTEFSLTRFLVPFLCGYQDYALFLDCDMLCLADITDVMLYPMADQGKAVYVAQHDYQPTSTTKFLGQPQTAYPRKCWSSVMLFDNARCQGLTPEYVNTATGLELHRFEWLETTEYRRECEQFRAGKLAGEPAHESPSERIGALPLEWNWLVGEYGDNDDTQSRVKVLHYTLGGPWFEQTANCDNALDWHRELEHLLAVGKTAAA